MEQFSVLRPANVRLPRRARTLAQIQVLLHAYTQGFSRSPNVQLAQQWATELGAARELVDDAEEEIISEALRMNRHNGRTQPIGERKDEA